MVSLFVTKFLIKGFKNSAIQRFVNLDNIRLISLLRHFCVLWHVENDTEEYVDSTASEPEAKPEPEQGKEKAPVIEQSQTTQQNPAAAALFS